MMMGGRISERETGRFEIIRVPGIFKERDRLIGRSDPVLDRYARVTFEKALINGQPHAELVAPGHPLLDAVVDVVLVRLSHVFSDSSVYCSGGVSVQTDVNSWMDRSTEFN
jgi:hypothetical protein